MSVFESEGRREVEVPWVARLHIARQFVEEIEIGLQLIATADDTERRMVAVVADDMAELIV